MVVAVYRWNDKPASFARPMPLLCFIGLELLESIP